MNKPADFAEPVLTIIQRAYIQPISRTLTTGSVSLALGAVSALPIRLISEETDDLLSNKIVGGVGPGVSRALSF